MKLDKLRADVESICMDMLDVIHPLCNSYSNSWARIIRDELESTCPNFQLVLNYANSYYEEAEGDGDMIILIARELMFASRRLSMAEKSALYSLQQEASLASTGPKRSLAQ